MSSDNQALNDAAQSTSVASRRRLWTFSIRELILLTFAVCAIFGWYRGLPDRRVPEFSSLIERDQTTTSIVRKEVHRAFDEATVTEHPETSAGTVSYDHTMSAVSFQGFKFRVQGRTSEKPLTEEYLDLAAAIQRELEEVLRSEGRLRWYDDSFRPGLENAKRIQYCHTFCYESGKLRGCGNVRIINHPLPSNPPAGASSDQAAELLFSVEVQVTEWK